MLRRWSGLFSAGRVSAFALLVLLAGSPPAAAQVDLVDKNMVGIRLGPWLADGLTTDIETEYVRVVSSSTAFHLEFFYLYQLRGPLYLDLNLGGRRSSEGQVMTGERNIATAEDEKAVGGGGDHTLVEAEPLAGDDRQGPLRRRFRAWAVDAVGLPIRDIGDEAIPPLGHGLDESGR